MPSFTLNPSANTSCAAPVQLDNDTWTVECTHSGRLHSRYGYRNAGTNWQQRQIDALQGGLIAELSGLVNEVDEHRQVREAVHLLQLPGRLRSSRRTTTPNTTGRLAQELEVDGSQTYQGSVALGGGQRITTNVLLAAIPPAKRTATSTRRFAPPRATRTATATPQLT
ncbi:MAG: hypothetical protein U0837_08025 [Dehalococcoidia bacterium]